MDDLFVSYHWIPSLVAYMRSDLEELIWDECLRMAHADGVLPVGPVMVRVASAEEKKALMDDMHPFKRNEVVVRNEVLYVAEVMVGASLE